MAFSAFGDERRQTSQIDSVSCGRSAGSTTGFRSAFQSSSSTRRRSVSCHGFSFQEPMCLGWRRQYALCRRLAEPQTRHDFKEWSLWRAPDKASARVRLMGLLRVCGVYRRTHRRRANIWSDPSQQQHYDCLAGTIYSRHLQDSFHLSGSASTCLPICLRQFLWPRTRPLCNQLQLSHIPLTQQLPLKGLTMKKSLAAAALVSLLSTPMRSAGR